MCVFISDMLKRIVFYINIDLMEHYFLIDLREILRTLGLKSSNKKSCYYNPCVLEIWEYWFDCCL